MKNNLMDLNNHLFAQLERLGEEDLVGEQLQQEIGRAKSITDIAGKIIDTAKVVLEGEQLRAEYGNRKFQMPPMIGKADD